METEFRRRHLADKKMWLPLPPDIFSPSVQVTDAANHMKTYISDRVMEVVHKVSGV